ncbi:tripartite tricarboxylate transporter substrate binding protein [Cupriavidus necator]|uniref:Bug family tripartite tricarboxylate transporter substrate binding protein n=1 Tax=Cupriavidus necator TaxID=106590 RepID=UPI0039C17DCE
MRLLSTFALRRRGILARLATGAAVLCSVTLAHAEYPDKPITLVVPFAAGGGTDITARLIGKKLAEAYRQAVVVDNKPGANTQIATRHVARAPSDGYTLLVASTSIVNNETLYARLPYQASRELMPVVGLVTVPAFLAVGPNIQARTVREFLAEARRKSAQGGLNFGSAGTGSTLHLAAEWFNQSAQLKAVHVPFKGSGPATVALAGGEVDYTFENLGPALAQIQSGRVRLLGVAGPARFPGLTGVPPLKEAGLPEVDLSSWFILMAPAQTPPAVIESLNAQVNRALADPEVKAGLLRQGFVPLGGSVAEIQARMVQDTGRWRAIIRNANVTIDQ